MEHAKNAIGVMLIWLLFLSNISCSDSKVSELKQQLQQKDEEYLRLKNDFKSTQELNDKQYEELIYIQKEMAKLDSLSLTFRYNVEHRQKTSYTMQDEIDALLTKIKDDIKQKNEIIGKQSKTENKLRILLATLTTQLEAKENEINQLKNVVNKQGETISIQNTKIGELENSKAILSQQIEELEIKKKELETKKRELETNMRLLQGEAFYNIGIALENAESNIPELSGLFISGAKKEEVMKTKDELRQQFREFYQKSARFGNQKAINKLN